MTVTWPSAVIFHNCCLPLGRIAELGGQDIAFHMPVAADGHGIAARDGDFLVFPVFERIFRRHGFLLGFISQIIAGHDRHMLVEIVDGMIAVNDFARIGDADMAFGDHLVDIARAVVGVCRAGLGRAICSRRRFWRFGGPERFCAPRFSAGSFERTWSRQRHSD